MAGETITGGSTTRRARVGVAAAAFVLLLAGCGDDEEPAGVAADVETDTGQADDAGDGQPDPEPDGDGQPDGEPGDVGPEPPTVDGPEPDLSDHPFAADEYVFDPLKASGAGDENVALPVPGDVPAVLTVRFEGPGQFELRAVDEDGDSPWSLTRSEPFEEPRVLNFPQPRSIAHYEVETEGEWTLTVTPMIEQPAVAPGGAFTGEGTHVVLVAPVPEEPLSPQLSYEGVGAWAVWAYGEDLTEQVATSSGTFDEAVELPAGTAWLHLDGLERWTVTLD